MLALGNKIIAGSFKAGASWEVGDVGISAFGIDEALNKRRYLNGQVISQAQFVEFTAMLKSRVSVYPSLAITEVNWQAEVTNSVLGQCGKFVIDDNAGTIRLPKVVNINGLQNLTGLGGIKIESLPNIKGATTYQANYNKAPTGPFVNSADTRANTLGAQSYITAYSLDFDASRSSSTYQDNAPVQQEAIQYPYFIQVAEGVETSVDVSREIELNNPFSLLDYKYSEYEISNASWLLSNGQWNSGAVYQSVYNLLLQIYNGTVTKAGVSVKLSTETYDDTDFVLNTGDTTFRLPTKVLMAGSKRVAGNGISLGFTDGANNFTIARASNQHYIIPQEKGYGLPVGSSSDIQNTLAEKTFGITTDETKSGIETSANGLYLYFYAGETIQDANIIVAAGVLTDIADLKSYVAGKPDRANGISTSLTITGQEYSYTCPSDGVVYAYGIISNDNITGYVRINGIGVGWTYNGGSSQYNGTFSAEYIVSKGDVVTAKTAYNSSGTGAYIVFFPFKGVN